MRLRPPRHAHGRKHPGDDGHGVGEQNEQKSPRGERRRSSSPGGVLPGRRREDDEREGEAAGDGTKQYGPAFERVADGDERGRRGRGNRQQDEPEREPAEARLPGQ